MTRQPHAVPLSDWASPGRITVPVEEFIAKALVAAELEIRKLRHDPIQLFTRAVQPVLWLTIFGQVFTQVRGIPTGNLSYLDFMTPGILAQSVLFMSIFTGLMMMMMMPLFFASNAIYPIEIMPAWLQVVSRLNPLTYMVDALRQLMLVEPAGSYSLGLSLSILVGVAAVLIAFCGRLYPRLVR